MRRREFITLLGGAAVGVAAGGAGAATDRRYEADGGSPSDRFDRDHEWEK